MNQQLIDKKADSQHPTAGSSRTSGHYNPYTLRYVPAPNPTTSVIDPKTHGINSEDSSNTVDSTVEWSMDVNEDDLVFSDDDFLESGIEILPKASTTKQLPTSIFHSNTKPPTVSSGSSEFRPSSTPLFNQLSKSFTLPVSYSIVSFNVILPPLYTSYMLCTHTHINNQVGRGQGGSIVKQTRPTNSE